MTQPKTNFHEASFEDCIWLLDWLSYSPQGGQYPWFGRDMPKGSLARYIATKTGYNLAKVYEIIKTLEVYRMIEVERLSHDYPCQHNFIIGLRRLGRAQWTAQPVYLWGSVQPQPTTTTSTPRLALVASEGVRVA